MKLLKITFQLSLSSLLICYIFSSDTRAQKKDEIKVFGDNCETVQGKLLVAASKFKETGSQESYLIIIAEASKGEKPRYNNDRISAAIRYFVKHSNISNERIVYGIGPPADKLGYLRFYINGELAEELKVPKNGRLCWGGGDPI
jgi:hypothetical protein